MLIAELLERKRSTELKWIRPEATLLEAANLLRLHDVGVLLVLNEAGGLAGLISERDLVDAMTRAGFNSSVATVGSAMTHSVIICSPDDSVTMTFNLMTEHHIRHIPVVENGKPSAVVSMREFNLAYQTLNSQSRIDHLTGLANRLHFMENAEQEMKRSVRFGSPVSLAVFDVDNFQQINESHGPDTGDHIISNLAKVLRRELRAYDVTARIGGDEFAILFPDTDITHAQNACDRLFEAIRLIRTESNSGVVTITASCGLVQSTCSGESVRSMLKRADLLLTVAKSAGGDRVAINDAPTEEQAIVVSETHNRATATG